MDIAANLDSMVSAEADHHLSAPTVAQLAAQTRKCKRAMIE